MLNEVKRILEPEGYVFSYLSFEAFVRFESFKKGDYAAMHYPYVSSYRSESVQERHSKRFRIPASTLLFFLIYSMKTPTRSTACPTLTLYLREWLNR